ncbi:hypothetical protein LZZ85_00510 [Terrimonas sp. NA20]|uniref:PEGA domain-containing protein n=1 Tax=Terrimonas ginsenosidimutans TaxID=2908004 RepID=A0ABS9KK80_9BACT|nr:hypothetical protein [Terrimonas ginsenosidimutans]MCG2612732.1 hypothetical protein [Terrimonas ginsenosidimutans]
MKKQEKSPIIFTSTLRYLALKPISMIHSFYFHSKFATLFIAVAFCITSYSQYNPGKELVIIPCKTGTLFIDGVEIGPIEADDAFRKKLTYGEHYLQLKTGAEKVNQTVTIDSLSKGIIRIGCEAAASSGQASNSKRLLEKQINLTGLIAAETDENMFALDSGDEIILNCDVLNKKGSVNITIQEYDKKIVIYQKERVSLVAGERIRVPARGVYQLMLQTQAFLGKDVQVTIDRIPGANSRADFNTIVKMVYDTIQTPFLTTRGRVYSTTNGKSSKVVVPVQLPPNANYWVYWIGLGEQSVNELKSMATNLAKVSRVIYPDPLVYYGLKLITALPVLNAPSTVTYFFTDNRNADAFIRSQPSVRFGDLPMGNNISNAYNIVNKSKSDLALVLFNESSFTGVDFEVRAVAFMVKPRFVIQD